MILQIRHLPDSADPARFQVLRLSDGKTGPATEGVPNPVGFPIDGWPGVSLLRGLCWYLENFLDYPFDPETTHAELVQKALKRWGEQAFDALFGTRETGGWFDAATGQDYADLHLQIVSDDPAVLAWPWEALYDRQAGSRLAHACQVERRLDHLRDPPELKKLPKDRVNILLVIARPYERDVRFRSVARALVEWASQPDVPAHVHVLRPPTFDHLREHLRQHRHFYHLLHFDGHGAYGDGRPATPGTHTFQGDVQGRLVFEAADGGPDPVAADKLSELLRDGAVPAVVLNACQSAMVDQRADDPFASVAAALLKAGTRSVTAMAYSLYVSGAQQFLPAFYRRLFEHGQLPEAVRAGRQQMLSQSERVCARGTFPLEDWLVPVLYQQDPPDFRFVQKAAAKEQPATRLPEEAQDQRNPYGFIGRDGPVLELERALHRPPAGILISGLGGVGKTALARGFLRWLEQTGGLGEGVFWFGFADIRSAEYVLDSLGEALAGPKFRTQQGIDKKLADLEARCRQARYVIVWDNFESAKGVAGTAVSAKLLETDCGLLRDFLSRLRGGPTKVLITSRSTEDWLGPTNRYLLKLGGLDGEERWEFANAVLGDLGRKVDRGDAAFDELMKQLNGHPLAMRVVLPRLESQRASDLSRALRENFESLRSHAADEDEARLFATLRFATDALPAQWHPLLIALAQHEEFVAPDLLEMMGQQVNAGWTRATIDKCLGALARAGLLRQMKPSLWEMHPALTGYLRSAFQSGLDGTLLESWVRSFTDVMAGVAESLELRPLRERQTGFRYFEASFHVARDNARRLGMDTAYATLTHAAAAYSRDTLDYPTAARLFQELADHNHRANHEVELAAALHHLGTVAQKGRDFAAAEDCYRKSLEISERRGHKRGMAKTYCHLGVLAEDRHDLDVAEGWYRKSLEIAEQLADKELMARPYKALGTLAEQRRELDAAEGWYRKSLAIAEQLGDKELMAGTYDGLGSLAFRRRDFGAAEGCLRKSLDINERLGEERLVAGNYHNLGRIDKERRDFDAAEGWYRKSLEISERLGDKQMTADNYHQLGWVAEERGDRDAAERWYQKALTLFQACNDHHNVMHVLRSRARNFGLFSHEKPPLESS
jgi:tetratricopeptide (TPR) repeat protein